MEKCATCHRALPKPRTPRHVSTLPPMSLEDWGRHIAACSPGGVAAWERRRKQARERLKAVRALLGPDATFDADGSRSNWWVGTMTTDETTVMGQGSTFGKAYQAAKFPPPHPSAMMEDTDHD